MNIQEKIYAMSKYNSCYNYYFEKIGATEVEFYDFVQFLLEWDVKMHVDEVRGIDALKLTFIPKIEPNFDILISKISVIEMLVPDSVFYFLKCEILERVVKDN